MQRLFRRTSARRGTRPGSLLSLLVIGLAFAGSASAQSTPLSANLNPAPTTLIPGYFIGGTSDAAGNIYVAVDNASIVKYTPGTNGYTSSTIYTATSGILSGFGMAVDASGNVYALNDLQLLKLTPGGSGYTSTLMSLGVTDSAEPDSVVVDAAGNLYVSLYSASGIQKWAPSGSSYSLVTTISVPYPNEMAVDGSGNIFVAANNSSELLELTPGSGNSYTTTTLNSGPSFSGGFIGGISLDGSGDVFFTTTGEGSMMPGMPSTPATVREAVPGSSGYTTTVLYTDPPSGVEFGSSNMNWQITAQPDGSLLVATTMNGMEELETSSVNLGATAIGGLGISRTVTFAFNGQGTLGAAPKVVTLGATGLDFADAGTGSCNTQGTTQTYNSGDTCTVNVTFKPLGPGLRSGAVMLLGQGGSVIGTAWLQGAGQGPQAFITPATVSKLPLSSNVAPVQMAMDGSGNLYFADQNANAVFKVDPSGTATQVNTGTSTLSAPFGVAIDGAGNLYIANTYGSPKLLEITTAGTVQAVSTGSYTLSFPSGLVVDGAGNLYVADSGNGRVLKITTAGVVQQLNTGSASLQRPEGLALDGAGNLYIADQGGEQVVKVSASGTASVLAGSLNAPWGIAADAAGDVYVGSNGGGTVQEIANGATVPLSLGSTAISGALGILLDPQGNLYLADSDNNQVLRLASGSAPLLNFPTATPVASTDTADGPQTAVLSNIGNQPLGFTAGITNPQLQGDFSLNGSDPSLCGSAITSLDAGATCDLSVNFQPTQSGNRTGALTITDNALNATGATQTIALTGTGETTQQTQTISFSVAASLTYGASPLPLTASASSGLPVAFSVVSGPATIEGNVLTITGAGTVVLLASQAGNAAYTAAPSVSKTITVNREASAVAVSGSVSGTAFTFTASVTPATAGVPSGTVQFMDGSTVLGSGTLNAQGVASYTDSDVAIGAAQVTAVYSGDANFLGSTSQPWTETVGSPDFSLNVNPDFMTLKAGQSGQATFTFAPINGYSGTVTFSCAGLPQGATCSFAPATLTANGSNQLQTSVLTIKTQGSSQGVVAMNRMDGASRTLAASIFLVPGLLFGGLFLWQRKKLNAGLQCLLLLVMLGATIGGLAGCGAAGSNTATTSKASVTVMATSSASGSGGSALSHTASFTLTITQ
ncbi:MAG TPA: Ig-like domain repeat protein [Acidobacteriaceae bacterium]|jgi:sugar lactone lactonase YvrE|nr:Ig-like domain repeat protein [Acidobacteriaceae bacterium]